MFQSNLFVTDMFSEYRLAECQNCTAVCKLYNSCPGLCRWLICVWFGFQQSSTCFTFTMFEGLWRSGHKCSFSCGCIAVHTNDQPYDKQLPLLNVEQIIVFIFLFFAFFIWIFDRMSDPIWLCAQPHTFCNSTYLASLSWNNPIK